MLNMFMKKLKKKKFVLETLQNTNKVKLNSDEVIM